MKYLLITVFSILLFSLHTQAFYCSSAFQRTDTIPPPPPAGSGQISGPSDACSGETSVFYADVPVDCTCQWAVNGIIQPGISNFLIVDWVQPGNQIVSVIFTSSGGQNSDPLIKNVMVNIEPEVYLGNDTLIIQGQSLLLDAGNPGMNYLWSTGETTQTISVSLAGSYSVKVDGFCGSDSDTLELYVAIGVDEFSASNENLQVSVHDRTIYLTNISPYLHKIQINSIKGELIYKGPPKKFIRVKDTGIYFLRGFYSERIITKKIFVP